LLSSALKSRVGIFDLTEKIHFFSIVDVSFLNNCLSCENLYEEVVQNLNLTLLFSAPPIAKAKKYDRLRKIKFGRS